MCAKFKVISLAILELLAFNAGDGNKTKMHQDQDQ